MRLIRWALLVGIAGILTACAGGTPLPSPDEPVAHDPVYVEHTELVQLESYPVQVRLKVEGQLPDPCHQAVWSVSDPDPEGRIDIDLHSEAPAGLDCIQVVQPLELNIPIGSFKTGSYTIWLNGQQVGAFDLPA